MSLSTITPQDAPIKRKQFKQRIVSSLNTEDIDGSKPCLKGYQYINKPEFSNNSKDIEKAAPKPLHPTLNKPEFNLKTSDICISHSKSSQFKSNRQTDPLNPVYKLPSFEVRPVTPPKFVRDSINIHDIPGAKPDKYFKWQSRDIISVNDIEGARPKPEKILTKPDLMNPKDINGEVFHSKRFTNPLEPDYVHRDLDGNLINIGIIHGSKPKTSLGMRNDPHRRNLDNKDIEGSAAGTLGLGVFGNKQRNYCKKLVDNDDIEGCKPGSHTKGIVTKRVTNPLDPKYAWSVEDSKDKCQNCAGGEEKVKEKPKISDANNEAFWGTAITNAISHGVSNAMSPKVIKNRPATCLPYEKPKSAAYIRNAHKFYEASIDSQAGFNRNTEKFFENPQKRLEDKFLAAQNPASIHRMKKEQKVISEYGLDKNIKGFCGDSISGLSRPSSSNSYQFKLSRKEIALPLGFEKISG